MGILDVLERIVLRPSVERALFGATAEEAVAARIAMIDRRVEMALDRLVDGLDEGESATQEQQEGTSDGTI